eukprot:gene6941-7601_t
MSLGNYGGVSDNGSFLGKAERFLDRIAPKLLSLARICILSTYVEDGLVPAILILSKKYVNASCACLALVVVFQTIAYQMVFDLHFFMRNAAVIGGLLFVIADHMKEATNIFSLAGRILIVIMFMTLIVFDSTLRIVLEILGIALVTAVAIGYKTKLSAAGLVLLLMIENIILNAFWTLPASSTRFDFKLYDFFQTMSVIGGLLMVVALGPGRCSSSLGAFPDLCALENVCDCECLVSILYNTPHGWCSYTILPLSLFPPSIEAS